MIGTIWFKDGRPVMIEHADGSFEACAGIGPREAFEFGPMVIQSEREKLARSRELPHVSRPRPAVIH